MGCCSVRNLQESVIDVLQAIISSCIRKNNTKLSEIGFVVRQHLFLDASDSS